MTAQWHPANGWTRDTILAQVKVRNNNSRCVRPAVDTDDTQRCAYEIGDNHCAVGCFIPAGHEALFGGNVLGVRRLLETYPDLRMAMPFDSADALEQFQNAHDLALPGEVWERVAGWLVAHVVG